MSIQSSLPNYTTLAKALKEAESSFQAAQVHGYICGLLCATSGKLDNSWENKILTSKNRTAREMLNQLQETSFHLVSEFSFEFSLLLPSDRTDINERTEALGLWCQGFLTGLKQHNIPVENREPGEMTDALNDILEIAQVSYGDLNTNDEDETAYFELVEYIRLAVLMIFHELKNDNPSKNPEDETWIH